MISTTDAQTHVDNALAAIEALVPDLEVKVFNRTYNLKKTFSDYAESVVVPDGQYAYDALRDFAKSQLGDGAKDTLLAYGFNALAADYAKNTVRSRVSAAFDLTNPFPGSITDSVINESKTFLWSGNLVASWAGLDFQLSPELEPPTILAFVQGINEHGFSGFVHELEGGTTVTLNLNASGTDWNGSFTGRVHLYDGYGQCTFYFGVSMVLYLR